MNPVKFPTKVLAPVKDFLSRQERRLRKRRADLSKQDPFEDVRRISDNAATDSDAAEQVGHELAEALKKEVERKLIQTKKALARIRIGKYGTCEKCGKMIDTDRLMIMPEATVCIACEKKKEK